MSLHIYSLINICTYEIHHFLLGFRRAELGVVQVGTVTTYGVDNQLDVGAYLLRHAGAPWVVVYIEQQEGHGAGQEEVVDDAGVGAAVVGGNEPAVFGLQDGYR